MNDEQFEREKLYQASMEMFHTMLDHGLITEEEYAFIDTKMREKYRPIIGTLLPR
ncbi:MAG: SHOCT domain-containing protein [Anaerovoracaceae bacterium]